MSIKPGMPGRRRRRHSEEFKARLIEECRHPGVSMASVAMANGINPNLLRNWVVRSTAGARSTTTVNEEQAAKEEFIALPLGATAPAVVGGEIRIELRRGTTAVSISWPALAAGECAAWLRTLLR